MGRFEKTVLTHSGIDRRELGYYSTPGFVARFMAEALLEINPNGEFVLDPCVGKEELIRHFPDKIIDGIDIYDHTKYQFCNFVQRDFIEYYLSIKSTLFKQEEGLKYDYYIANPPYNCHEVDYIRSNKKSLRTLFPSVGVYNMYSMFISAIIDCAKEGALIALISSDSFLTTKSHAALRNQILDTCSIHYLILCPTTLFADQKADVRTCIIILQKGTKFQKGVRTFNRPKNKAELEAKLLERKFDTAELSEIVNPGSEHEFLIDIPAPIKALFNLPRIEDHFRCVTGISTGNDSRFLSKERKEGFEIPFYKNPGRRKFYCEPDGFLTNDYLSYDKSVKNFMVRNKSLMLKEGITCSSMGLPFSACYLPSGSTFGVNANIFCSPEDIWWLIAYLNSSLVTYFVRGILLRSNMITSGYVSKIPLLDLPENFKIELSNLAENAYNNRVHPSKLHEVIKSIDDILFRHLSLPDDTREEILHFASNLQIRV